jgi:hypothetical protein
MTKKLMFILLMSGVILSPMGAYAMDEEGAPRTPVSKAVPPDIQMLKEKIRQGQNEQMRKHPGESLFPHGSYLSPDEAKRYHDYYRNEK